MSVMRKETIHGIEVTIHNDEPVSDAVREFTKMIADAGGPAKFFETDRDHWKPFNLMKERHAELMEKYPDKWVVMGDDGLICTGDSREEVCKVVDDLGIRRDHVRIKFMDTNPPIMIPTAWMPK